MPDANRIDRYGLYMGLLKVHFMCEGSGAYSGYDSDIFQSWIIQGIPNLKKRKRRRL